MSICIPCAKEILNNGAQARLDSLRAMSRATPAMVAAGQITPAQAEDFLASAMQIEQTFIAAADLVLDDFVNNAFSPWSVPSGGGV